MAPNERKVRIEVGRGLEPQLTDLMSKLIIENAILPAFRRNDFSGGIKAGVHDIRDVLLGDAEAVKERARLAKKRSQRRRQQHGHHHPDPVHSRRLRHGLDAIATDGIPQSRRRQSPCRASPGRQHRAVPGRVGRQLGRLERRRSSTAAAASRAAAATSAAAALGKLVGKRT